MFTRYPSHFLRYLISYLLILIVPLLIGIYNYAATLQVIENDLKQANMNMLRQARDIVDLKLADIQSFVSQLSNDPKIVRFQRVTNPHEDATTFQTLETVKGLNGYGLQSRFVIQYFLFFRNSGLAMTNSLVYPISDFYKSILRYRDVDFDAWKDKLFEKYYFHEVWPASEIRYEDRSYEAVTYVQSLGHIAGHHGAIAVLIDNRELKNLLGGFDLRDGGWAYVVDRNGQILSSVSGVSEGSAPPLLQVQGSGFSETRIGDMTVYVTHIQSESNGWKYVVAQPSFVYLKKVHTIRTTTITVFLATLLLGAAVAVILAYRNYKPVRRLISSLLDLQDKLQLQLPYLRATLFERLLKGELRTDEEIRAWMNHAQIDSMREPYIVVVLQISGYRGFLSEEVLTDLEMKSLLLREAVTDGFGIGAFSHPIDGGKIAILIQDAGGEKDRFRNRLKQQFNSLSERLETMAIRLTIGIGSRKMSLADISRSFEEASIAAEHGKWNEIDIIVWYEELPNVLDRYFYPSDLEIRLMNVTRSGDTEVVQRLLEELYRDNFQERLLSLPTLKSFLFDLWGSILKLSETPFASGEWLSEERKRKVEEDLHTFHSPKDIFRTLEGIFFSASLAARESRSSSNRHLASEILRHLDNRFRDPNLSLARVADHFRLSEVYLSQFLKEQTGINFSDYLETLRLNRAAELLSGTELPVAEIAGQCGYNSYNTFCKAFKRIKGVSATSYRGLRKAGASELP